MISRSCVKLLQYLLVVYIIVIFFFFNGGIINYKQSLKSYYHNKNLTIQNNMTLIGCDNDLIYRTESNLIAALQHGRLDEYYIRDKLTKRFNEKSLGNFPWNVDSFMVVPFIKPNNT